MITIFKTGYVEYPESLNKPVKYDSSFLKNIASETSTINITQEHSNENVGVMENFIFENGCLLAKEPENLELKGMGFSPVFECDFIDKGDYYKPVNGKLTEIGFTEKPRSQILYNSIEANKMSGESIDTLLKERNELMEQIGVLKNQNESYKEIIGRHKDEISEIKESYADVDSKLEELEALKSKAEEYDSIQQSIKEEMLTEVCGDDDKLKEKFESFDIDQLRVIKDTKIQNKQGQGITPQDAGNLDTDGNNPAKSEVYSREDFARDIGISVDELNF